MGAPGREPRPARLLVADDHTMLRSALCDILRLEPSLEIVAEAGNGEETVELAVAHRPDLVLLDVEMPGQTAAVTVAQLVERVPDAKILILSMYDDRQLICELLSAGASAYLHKSATRETLVSALRLVATPGRQVVISLPRERAWCGAAVPPVDGRGDAVLHEPVARVLAASPAGPYPPGGSGVPGGSGASGGPGDAEVRGEPEAAGDVPGPATAAAELSARELEVLELVATARSNRQIAVRLGITESTVKRHLRNIFGKLGAVSRIDAVNKAKQAGVGVPGEPLAPGRSGPTT